MFSRAGEVYSAAGFRKYGGIYGTLIGLFLTITALFLFLLRLDSKGTYKYRLAVEDIEEVCKVLGYSKPLVTQPAVSLPPLTNDNCGRRFAAACIARLVYQHSYVGLFFRYDPRLPRGFRLLLLATVAFHTLFLSVLFYGYTAVSSQMSFIESIVLSVITSALNIPFLRIVLGMVNSVGIYEYAARFPDFAHEYYRRRKFEAALRSVPTPEILRIATRLKSGKAPARAIQISPLGLSRVSRRGSIDHSPASSYQDNTGDVLLNMLLDRCFAACRRRRQRNAKTSGVRAALELAQDGDPHFETPACDACPTKTFYGAAFSFAAFAYIAWIMNYILLFTASQSTQTMNGIATSFGISTLTSILFTQPLTLFLTLLGSWGVSKCRRSSNKNHIGYFVDPSFQKNSSSLSGSWAYWLFLYGGSVASIGLNSATRPLGYSSTKVALEWLNGNHTLGLSERDTALATLYVYLRGLEKPLTGRAAAAAAAAAMVISLLEEAPHSSILPEEKMDDVETGELANIVELIEDNNKDARPGIISESTRNGGAH
jgi:hypothetical protein